MRAVQITRFGGPEVLDVVDLPHPTPGPDQRVLAVSTTGITFAYEVSSAGVNFADTHHPRSAQPTAV